MSVQVSTGNNAQKRASSASGNSVTNSTTYATLLNITGKGILNALKAINSTGSLGIRVTIDGNVIVDTGQFTSGTVYFLPLNNTSAGGALTPFEAEFNQSLKIEALTNGSSYPTNVYWNYSLE